MWEVKRISQQKAQSLCDIFCQNGEVTIHQMTLGRKNFFNNKVLEGYLDRKFLGHVSRELKRLKIDKITLLEESAPRNRIKNC